MHAFAFFSPFVTEHAKTRVVTLIETALPHLHQKSHESIFELVDWLTKLFSTKPREYNHHLWTHVDLKFPLIGKETNDRLWDIYYGVDVPWDGLDYTGDIRAFEFPSQTRGGTRRLLNRRRKVSSR